MAVSKNNLLTHGLKGTVGDLLVFRTRGSQVVVTGKPKERTSEYSAAEKAHQQAFQQATIYGKSVLADPAVKAEYASAAKGGQSAYNVAVADYFYAPDITEIDVTEYTGKKGSTIELTVTDDFKVSKVKVSVFNGDGTLIEETLAVQDAANENKWLFTATVDNASIEGDRIEIKAYDLPGNETVKSENL